MKKYLIPLAVISLTGAATTASADMFAPSHGCSPPYKPYRFNSEYELDRFKDEVDEYKRCISDFVDEQNEAAQNHQNAAEEAIDEWNRYVQYELD